MLILSLVIVYLSFHLTVEKKLYRITTGAFLILSIFSYPLTFTLIMEIKPELDTVGAVVLFHLILLLGGITEVIVGIFTKNSNKTIK